MIDIDERGILEDNIISGVNKAFNNFRLIYKNIYNENNFYKKLVDSMFMLTKYSNLLDGSMEIIKLDENTDIEKLNIFLNIIKKETYSTGLRIIKNESNTFIYLIFNNVYNKIYYVDDDTIEYKKIKRFL